MAGVHSTDYIKKMHWALEYVTLPDGTSDPSDNPKIRYHYENSSFPFVLTGITDERGIRWATWTYGTDGRVASSERAGGVDNYLFSYNDTAHSVTVTNPLSKQTVYHFTVDPRGLNRLTQIEGVASTHCAAADTFYAYDSSSFLTRLRMAKGGGRLKTMTVDPTGTAAMTSIEYDGPGDITKITRPNGAFLQYT